MAPRTNRKRKRKGAAEPSESRVWIARFAYTLLGFFALGELSRWVWLGAVSEQVRAYLLPVLWALAAWAARARLWPVVGLTVLATGLAVVEAWPLWRAVDGAPSRGPELRLTTLGLDGQRPSDADLARWLREETADLIVLAGAPYAPEARIHGTAGYRALTVRPAREGETTLTLLTRLDLDRRPVRGKDGAVRTSLHVERCPLALTYVSLPSVWNAAHSSTRRETFAGFETHPEAPARLWAGDFGGDLRAPGPRALMERGRLRDSRAGRGVQATWPGALGPMGIAMDHVLVGGWVAVRERTSGEAPRGSSRRSARVKVQLTSPDCRS